MEKSLLLLLRQADAILLIGRLGGILFDFLFGLQRSTLAQPWMPPGAGRRKIKEKMIFLTPYVQLYYYGNVSAYYKAEGLANF